MPTFKFYGEKREPIRRIRKAGRGAGDSILNKMLQIGPIKVTLKQSITGGEWVIYMDSWEESTQAWGNTRAKALTGSPSCMEEKQQEGNLAKAKSGKGMKEE